MADVDRPSTSYEDEDVAVATSVLLLATATIGMLLLKKKKKRKHAVWVKKYITRREKYGVTQTLLMELSQDDVCYVCQVPSNGHKYVWSQVIRISTGMTWPDLTWLVCDLTKTSLHVEIQKTWSQTQKNPKSQRTSLWPARTCHRLVRDPGHRPWSRTKSGQVMPVENRLYWQQTSTSQREVSVWLTDRNNFCWSRDQLYKMADTHAWDIFCFLCRWTSGGKWVENTGWWREKDPRDFCWLSFGCSS